MIPAPPPQVLVKKEGEGEREEGEEEGEGEKKFNRIFSYLQRYFSAKSKEWCLQN